MVMVVLEIHCPVVVAELAGLDPMVVLDPLEAPATAMVVRVLVQALRESLPTMVLVVVPVPMLATRADLVVLGWAAMETR